MGADNLVYNGTVLLDIIDAFKMGTKYNSIATTEDFGQSVSVDFSSLGLGNVIFL